MEPLSPKEKRIKAITQLYYSRPEIQKTIYEFSRSRETVPRFVKGGFGKRPDTLEYPSDIFQLVKKGATSFHCSEELWKNPRDISTDMTPEQLSEHRVGWDLLIDIDSKYLDYSKIMAKIIIEFLAFHGVKNIGVKFSGSKGFHILVPWQAFPKKANETNATDMFPEWPRIIVEYIASKIKNKLTKEISNLEKPSKYIMDYNASKEVMPDLVLVSPRHLFRTPYSLHEKTALASVVIDKNEIEHFDVKDADPNKATVQNFMPKTTSNEAKELLISALDWYKHKVPLKKETKIKEFAPIKIDKLSDEFLPPSIQQILKGVNDGRKRALFIIINLFRSIGMEKDELEKRIEEWNKKNKVPLKKGYVTSQLVWSYRNKVVPPPNFDKDYYKAIGVEPTPEELRVKNPVTWVTRKAFGNKKRK